MTEMHLLIGTPFKKDMVRYQGIYGPLNYLLILSDYAYMDFSSEIIIDIFFKFLKESVTSKRFF